MIEKNKFWFENKFFWVETVSTALGYVMIGGIGLILSLLLKLQLLMANSSF